MKQNKGNEPTQLASADEVQSPLKTVEKDASSIQISASGETEAPTISATPSSLSPPLSPPNELHEKGSAHQTEVDHHHQQSLNQTAIKLLVSNNSSGCIIGRSGKTISELQADSSTRIKLSQGGDYYPGTQDRVCLIQGSLDNARVAVEMILLKLLQVESLKQIQMTQMATVSTTRSGTVYNDATASNDSAIQSIVNEFGSVAMPFTIQVLVPTPSCGMLIGRGGSNIKSIKEESGVSFIQLSQKEQDNNHTANAIMSNTAINTAATTSERIITISGCFESCVKCVQLILEEMASNPEVSRYMNMTTSYSKVVAAQQSAATAQSSQSPSSRQGIGQHFSPQHQHAVYHVQQHYDDNVVQQRQQQQESFALSMGEVPHPYGLASPPRNVRVPLEFLGHSPPSPELYQHQYHRQASSAGNQRLQFWSPNTLSGTAGSPTSHHSMVSPTGSNLSSVDQVTDAFQTHLMVHSPPSLSAPNHSIQFGIPESMVGFVLGRGGKTLTQLQEQSQTRIRLSQRGEFLPGTNQRVLTITGNTAEHVANAQYLINQRLSEKGSSRR